MLRRTRPARVRQRRPQSRLGSWATLSVGPRRPAGEFPPDGRRCYANHSKITTITRTSASVPLASTRAGPGHCRRLPRRRHVPLPAQGRSSELAAPTQNDAHDHESQKTADNKGGDRDTAIGPCRLTVQRRLTVERDLTNDSFFNPCLQKENRRHIDAPLCSRIVQADSR